MKKILISTIAVIVSLHSIGMDSETASAASTTKSDREKSSILIGKDDRRTVKQYASQRELAVGDVEKMFAATGKLNCPWIVATANLVAKDDIIVTNAHVILDRKGKQKGNLNSCHFVTRSNGTERKFRLSKTYLAGHSTAEARTMTAQDWLVVRLEKSVPGVKPYSFIYPKNPIAPNRRAQSRKHRKVTVVAARHGDWPTINGRVFGNVKSVSECKIRDITWPGLRLTVNGVRAFRSDCDSGPGSSGSAYFWNRSGEQSLVGLITGFTLSAKLGRQNYEFGKHDARGVLLSGAFLDAVQNMASLMGIADIQQALADLGYEPGVIDGQMGRKTRNAIKAFQRTVGMPETGNLSVELNNFLVRKLDN